MEVFSPNLGSGGSVDGEGHLAMAGPENVWHGSTSVSGQSQMSPWVSIGGHRAQVLHSSDDA